MPSFDISCETDMQEIDNAVNGMKREMDNRYDFKGGHNEASLEDKVIVLRADDEYKLTQMQDLLKVAVTRRQLDSKCLDFGKMESSAGTSVVQRVSVRQGVDQDTAKQIVKEVKGTKTKVQVAIRGEEVRVTAKKRDELQAIILLVKEMNIELPLHFGNFRD